MCTFGYFLFSCKARFQSFFPYFFMFVSIQMSIWHCNFPISLVAAFLQLSSKKQFCAPHHHSLHSLSSNMSSFHSGLLKKFGSPLHISSICFLLRVSRLFSCHACMKFPNWYATFIMPFLLTGVCTYSCSVHLRLIGSSLVYSYSGLIGIALLISICSKVSGGISNGISLSCS